MGNLQPNVIIKGKKEGMTFHLNDQCALNQLMDELMEHISTIQSSRDGGPVNVSVDVGYRYLNEEQKQNIVEIIEGSNKFTIDQFDSLVVTKDQAIQWKKSNEITKVCKIVRSGQEIRVDGDLLLVGDVNPGARIVAGGHIFVLGNLRGVAHGGLNGDRNAIVAASNLDPMQIIIGDVIGRAPDQQMEQSEEFDFAYINDENQIEIAPITAITSIRPNISKEERGIQPWEMQL